MHIQYRCLFLVIFLFPVFSKKVSWNSFTLQNKISRHRDTNYLYWCHREHESPFAHVYESRKHKLPQIALQHRIQQVRSKGWEGWKLLGLEINQWYKKYFIFIEYNFQRYSGIWLLDEMWSHMVRENVANSENVSATNYSSLIEFHLLSWEQTSGKNGLRLLWRRSDKFSLTWLKTSCFSVHL